jgi:Ca-activated chloride channel family protein
MMMSSGMPIRPSMIVPSFYKGYQGPRNCTTFAVLATLLFLAGADNSRLSAQFSSGVNVVEVYAAVVDANGNPVTGLRREDFTVLEDSRPQTVSAFAEGDFPLSVAIGLDRSFSMGTRQLPSAVSATRTFLGELRPQDQSMIVAIGSEIEVVAELSTDRGPQQRALAELKPWGTTGLHDAIVASIDAIQAAKGRRALVLLSDGNDRYSKASASDALNRARRSDVMVYPVATGRNRPSLFAELASLTGGRSFQPGDPGQLNIAMRTIANELRHQYLLGYTPSRPIASGEEQWRAITVRVARTDAQVRARDGYLAR